MAIELLSPEKIKDTDLVKSHRDLFQNYVLNQTKFGRKNLSLLLKIYDRKVNTKNIRSLYNRHIKIFTTALITDTLDTITKYI